VLVVGAEGIRTVLNDLSGDCQTVEGDRGYFSCHYSTNLFVGCSDGSIEVRSAEGDYQVVSVIKGHSGEVNCLATHDDLLLSAADDKKLCVHTTTTYKTVGKLQLDARVFSLVLTINELYVRTGESLYKLSTSISEREAVGEEEDRLRGWRQEQQELAQAKTDSEKDVHSYTYLPKGQGTIVTADRKEWADVLWGGTLFIKRNERDYEKLGDGGIVASALVRQDTLVAVATNVMSQLIGVVTLYEYKNDELHYLAEERTRY